MSSGTRICSGSLSDFEALGVGGDPIYRAAVQIRTILQKEYGAETSELLAIPFRDERSDSIDWYTELSGNVSSLAEWSNEDQDNFRQEIAERLRNVRELSDRYLSDTNNETARIYGKFLQCAQVFPTDDQIYVVGRQPVIVFWGFRRYDLDLAKGNKAEGLNRAEVESNGVVAEELKSGHADNPAEAIDSTLSNVINTTGSNDNSKKSPSLVGVSDNGFKPPLSSAAVGLNGFHADEAKRGSWWQRYGWWLFLVLLLILGIPSILRGFNTDFHLYEPTALAGNCRDGAPAACPDVKSFPPQSSPIPAQTKEPPPRPLDPKSLESKDLEVFNGKWVLDTGLFMVETNEPVRIELTFGVDGAGTALSTAGKQVCNAEASAKITSKNSFTVQMTKSNCNTGTYLSPQSIKCIVRSDYKTADCSNFQCISGECPTIFERR